MFCGHGVSCKGGFRCWHWVKCVLGARGQLKRGFEVLALRAMCFEGMGHLQRGFEVLAPGEICFEGMGAVRKGI